VSDLRVELAAHGYVRCEPMHRDEFEQRAQELGAIVGRERIGLRAGAHAYVAKPGAVPLHTDQPEVHVIGWWCEEQDTSNGATKLLDARPLVESLPVRVRETLRRTHLVTPPLMGGPPTMTWSVLTRSGDHDDLFCSPWLRAIERDAAQVEALTFLRNVLSDGAKASAIKMRLRAGEALFVDNRRVLHGRGSISPTSQRTLHRVWIARSR